MEPNTIFIILIVIFIIAVLIAYNFLSHSREEETIKESNKLFEDKPNVNWNISDIEIKNKGIKEIKNELDKYIAGNNELKLAMIISFFTKSHLLIESVPWLAKTTTVKLFSKIVGFEESRIQGTPDLLPSDIIWNQILSKDNKSDYSKWPIFANIILFDEINRTTPKTQSALIQAMEEKAVTIYDDTIKLPDPFVVFATLNPIEQRGTYSLPEAQLDRFSMKVVLNYPTKEDEKKILWLSSFDINSIKAILTHDLFYKINQEIEKIWYNEDILDYIADILEQSRTDKNIKIGWSPRVGKDILKLAKAIAYIKWADYIDISDIDMIKNSALRHRVILK